MTQKKTLLTRLQASWWFAWIVATVLALSQLKNATEGIDSLLVFCKVKPDALALAQAAEKGEFSRGLTEAQRGGGSFGHVLSVPESSKGHQQQK